MEFNMELLIGAGAVFALAIFKPTWFQAANTWIKSVLASFGVKLP